jgi:hypothetical protein
MALNTGERLSPGGVQDQDGRLVVLVDSGGAGSGTASYPTASVPVTSSSGNVAAATATATLPAVAAKTTYITGFEITAAGATAGAAVVATVTGTVSGTLSYVFTAPTGATVGAAPLTVEFSPALPSSAVNTAIVVTLPSLGAGNTNAAVVAHGFQL